MSTTAHITQMAGDPLADASRTAAIIRRNLACSQWNPSVIAAEIHATDRPTAGAGTPIFDQMMTELQIKRAYASISKTWELFAALTGQAAS